MGRKENYEGRVEEYLLPLTDEHHFEPVDVEYVREAGTRYLRAYIDREGGIAVNDCEVISRELGERLDKENFIDENYILEVSSPGLGHSLREEKGFIRSMGKDVDVRLYRQIDKQKEFTSALSTCDENTVTLTTEDDSFMVFEKLDTALIRLALDF